jgi:hypothetical protein
MYQGGQWHLLPARDMWPTLLATFDDTQLLAKQEKFEIFRFIRQPSDSRQIQDEHPHKQHHLE